ncbi:hypothetical protein FEM48_Zijuj05G0108800 [Ziziphus jujuba var. spinosa]|uniref:Pentatricopeptide repeat-containing protein At1g53330 n=1 Tax=Ziziphus jujuba var. spinosa TaxID=714518 RepID=A0A978VEJ3_ZIZJJ|nr:hypothetical protein FEM48_Zijuj05G0108800 [Ziziphus jujuba var. spinosa]
MGRAQFGNPSRLTHRGSIIQSNSVQYSIPNDNLKEKTQMKTMKPISSFRLSSLLRLQKDPILALQLFQNPNPQHPKRHKPFRYSLLAYDLIISKLGRAKMFDPMEQILQQLKQETRFAPPEIIFCNVICFYGRARLPQRALQVFDEIPSFRCQRTVKSFNSLLDALCKCSELQKVREIFMDIENYVYPDACTYNILIKACCTNGSLDDAWVVFDEMRSKGFCPNVVTFGNLIYGLCTDLKLKEAFNLKEDMTRVYGVKPNAFVYTSLIKGLCKIDDLSLAFKLKEEMVNNKIKLDSAVYSTLIGALFKVGRKDEVSGILEEMTVNGCEPDTVTYNAMINGFCKEKDFEAAYGVLDEMVKKNCKPDIISYNVIIGGLCKEGKWIEGNDLFEDLPRRGCKPDVVSYRTIFDGFCNWRRFKEAMFILEEMVFKGYSPCSASIHKLLDGLCQEGNVEFISKVLNSIGNANVVDLGTWGSVISVVCKKDKQSDSINLIDTLLVS